MNRIIKIYCEGKKGSHDFDILEKVINNLTSSQIQIDPIGSVRGAKAIIQYKETTGVVKSDFHLFFRDRDFDREIPEKPSLENDSNKVFYSYRNTIENYLFDPTHLFNFIFQEKKTEQYAISNENDARQKIIEAAEKIKYYQAIRHTMGRMRTEKTNFGTKWTDKSGILPNSLEYEYCKQKALEKINISKSFTDEWTEEKFDEILNSFLVKFDTEFMNNLDFLVHFQGKDFAISLTLVLKDFPLNSYYKYAKKHFDYHQFSDLVQLRKLIEENL